MTYHGKSTAGWRIVGNRKIFFRSKWEFNYSLYLQFLKDKKIIVEWEHEPYTFWFEEIKRGVRSYLPDFRVTWETPTGIMTEWHEVKGYKDPKSLTKLKRMAKYYPNEKIVMVDAKWFTKNNPKFRGLIKGWE